jgi:hypothetical protein
MDTGTTYRFADRTLHDIAVQRMSAAGWRRYEAAVLGMQLAVDTGHVDELHVCAEFLATLRIPHQKAGSDPTRTDQPVRLHQMTMRLAEALATLVADHPAQ